MDENNVMLKDTRGFDLLNGISLFVHYTNYRSKLSEEENKTLTERYTKFLVDYSINKGKVIAYPEEDTLFINEDNVKVIGKSAYYIFEDGIKKKIDVD